MQQSCNSRRARPPHLLELDLQRGCRRHDRVALHGTLVAALALITAPAVAAVAVAAIDDAAAAVAAVAATLSATPSKRGPRGIE